jgi:hypothetical protein
MFTRKFFLIYLIYSITLYTNPAFALGSNLGGWVKTGTSRSGSATTYNGSRSYNHNYAGSTSINTTGVLVPLGLEIAGALATGGGYALAVTALGIAYYGYEAVQDYQNNRYKLTKPADPSKSSQLAFFHPEVGECYSLSNCTTKINQVFTDADCSMFTSSQMRCYVTYHDASGSHRTYINLSSYYNPVYDPAYTPVDDVVYVPLEQVGNQILQMADAGNQDAIDFVGQVSDSSWTDAPASQSMQNRLLNELNKNAQYPSQTNVNSNTDTQASTTQPNASGTTTTNSHSTTSTELPAFCSYATKLCDWLDWTQELPTTNENTKVDVYTNDTEFTPYNVSFSSSCPAPYSSTISFFDSSFVFSFPFTPLCDFLTLLRPFVVGGAYLTSIYILSGIRKD